MAPQGLDYIVAFLGALEAGLIAVPLSVPTVAIHDERVTAVLRDASPSVVLTTSAVVESVVPYALPSEDTAAPSVVEIDSLDLDSRKASGARRRSGSDIAYLQYTSGSTRTPAGVVVSHKNLLANWEQMVATYIRDYQMPQTTVSWLPFYHDMGLMCGMCTGIFGGWPSVITSPIAFLQRPARWMQLLASNPQVLSAAPNFAFDLAAARTSDDDMAGLDLGDVLFIISGAERVNPATITRFNQRFAAFNLPDVGDTSVLWARRGNRLRCRRRARQAARFRPFRAREVVGGPREAMHNRHAVGQLRQAAVASRANRRSRNRHREPGGDHRRDLGAR